MNIEDRVPKTLPKENPLLFSFLMILDSLKINVRFNGKYSEPTKKLLPAFEYGVNKWKVVEGRDGDIPNGIFTNEMEVMAAFWTDEPINADCKKAWDKFPNGNPLNEQSIAAQYAHEFEQWRIDAADSLTTILYALVGKGVKFDNILKIQNKYLTDAFGWEIPNNEINFVYAKDVTANKFYGIGAVFTLRGFYKNCCPAPDYSLLTQAYFESKGFVFE